MHILLTNDDGIQAVGIRALYRAFVDAGHRVDVTAPITEQSAVGHAVTLASPLRVKEFREQGFYGRGVSGTPADCVKLGLSTLLDKAPDIVVSGINSGPNVGVDILYSGTVSAATEGALMGLPAVAVSYDDYDPKDLAGQAAYVERFIRQVDWKLVPAKRVLNLNFPKGAIEDARELKVCPQTQSTYQDWFETRKDPRGKEYYWMNGAIPPETVLPGTDRDLLSQGHVTLTPLRFDFTDRDALAALASSFGG